MPFDQLINVSFVNRAHRSVRLPKQKSLSLRTKASDAYVLFNTEGVVSFDILKEIDGICLTIPNALFSDCGKEQPIYDADISWSKIMSANPEISCVLLKHPTNMELSIHRDYPVGSRIALNLPKGTFTARYSYLARNKDWNLVVSVFGE